MRRLHVLRGRVALHVLPVREEDERAAAPVPLQEVEPPQHGVVEGRAPPRAQAVDRPQPGLGRGLAPRHGEDGVVEREQRHPVDRPERGQEALHRLAAGRHRRPHAAAHVDRHHQLALGVRADEVGDLAAARRPRTPGSPPARRPFTSRPSPSVTVAATCTTSTSTGGEKPARLGPHRVDEPRAVGEHGDRADAVGRHAAPGVPRALPRRRLARAHGVAVRGEGQPQDREPRRLHPRPQRHEAAHVGAGRGLLDHERRRRGASRSAQEREPEDPGEPRPHRASPRRRRGLQRPAPGERGEGVVEAIARQGADPRVEAETVVEGHGPRLGEQVGQERPDERPGRGDAGRRRSREELGHPQAQSRRTPPPRTGSG